MVGIALLVNHKTDKHETDNIGDEEPIHIDQLQDMYTHTWRLDKTQSFRI